MTRAAARPIPFIGVLFGLIVALSLLIAPQAAHAAADANAWYAVDVALYDLEPGLTPTLVITGLLKEGTRLPAEVALSVPKGASIGWSGEILGGDPSEDPMITVEVIEGDTHDLAVFTLTQSPRVQLELSVPESFITDAPGSRAVDISWVSAGEIDRARVAVSLQQSYHMTAGDPDPTVEYRASDTLYSVETSPVAKGQTLELSGQLAEGADPGLIEMMGSASDGDVEETVTAEPLDTGAGTPQTAETGDNTWLIVGALALLLAIVAFALWRQVRR